MVEKALNYKLSHSKLAITDMREKPSVFFFCTAVGFCSRNNFANLGSFATVSVPIHLITPWFNMKGWCRHYNYQSACHEWRYELVIMIQLELLAECWHPLA